MTFLVSLVFIKLYVLCLQQALHCDIGLLYDNSRGMTEYTTYLSSTFYWHNVTRADCSFVLLRSVSRPETSLNYSWYHIFLKHYVRPSCSHRGASVFRSRFCGHIPGILACSNLHSNPGFSWRVEIQTSTFHKCICHGELKYYSTYDLWNASNTQRGPLCFSVQLHWV